MKKRRLFPPFLIAFGLGLVVFAVAAFPSATVSGRVLRSDGQPAEGAWVRLQASDNLTYADFDGSFTLTGLTEGVTVTITAWYPENKVGWTTLVPPAENFTITLQTYDTGDNPDYIWNTSYPDPDNPTLGCGHCMRPSFDEWQLTAHATAGTNPRFFSLYNGTNITGTATVTPGYQLDFPGTAGNCATCHAPGAAYDAPFTTDMNTLTDVDREGVFCEYCHKVGAVYINPSTGRPYENAPGVLSTRLYRPFPGDQIFFGSLDDVNRRVSYLPLEKQSQFCAPCHQFSFWGTPIYQSFREWKESKYPYLGIECQTCHDPTGTTPTFVPLEKGGLVRDPERLASHKDLGIKDTAFMTSTIAMTLTTQTVDDRVEVRVTLENVGAGHHVPTDHPGRHLILTVEAHDHGGKPLTQLSGEVVPSWGGDQAGLPGKAFAKVLQDAQSGVYPVVSYWKQTFIVSDNRIPAMGSDTSAYVFIVSPGEEAVTLDIALRFRRTFQDEMDARGWEEPDILMAQISKTMITSRNWQLFLPLVRH